MDQKKLGDTLYDRIVKKAEGEYKLNINDRDILTVNLSFDEVSKLLLQPKDLFVDDRGQLIAKVDGEEWVIDPKESDYEKLKNSQRLISRLLPNVNFEVDGGGNIRKSKEISSIYKVAVTNAVTGSIYKDEINLLLKGYDFKDFKTADGDGEAFSNLLKQMQEDAGPVAKFVINCCSIILTAMKEKKDTAHIGIISEADASSLNTLKKEIKLNESECNDDIATNNYDKLGRLTRIRQKEDLNEKVLSKYPPLIQIFYKISKLNSDFIPQKKLTIIRRTARIECEKLVLEGVVDQDYFSKVKRFAIKRAMRKLVYDLKVTLFNKTLQPDCDFETLIPKL